MNKQFEVPKMSQIKLLEKVFTLLSVFVLGGFFGEANAAP
jgi:hypothetical protein